MRRHQKWLWMVIIAATIITFVYYLTPNMRNGGMFSPSYASANYGSINGEPIAMDEMRDATAEARILYRLNYQEWPDPEAKKEDLKQFAWQRLLLDSEIKSFHITVTQEAAARYIKALLGVKPGEVVPADKILEVLTKLAQEGGLTINDFDRFARHQAGQEYLMALVGMSGRLITPQEASVFYLREHQPVQAELVQFPLANYYATTNPAESELQDFYTKRGADYRVPDRIQVNYIEFAASNYTAKAEKQEGTNLNNYVDQAYLQQGAAAFKDAKGNPLTADAAKAKIKKEVMLEVTRNEARRDANKYMEMLTAGHDDDHPYSTEDLFNFAKTNNLSVKTTDAFDLHNPPKDLSISEKGLHTLFSLRESDAEDKEHSLLYAPSPLLGETAVYIVGLQKRIPSSVQPFSDVRAKLLSDYRENHALEMAKAAGDRFQSALEAGMAQGKTFDTMCAAQFVHPKTLSGYSLVSTNIPELTNKTQVEEVLQVTARMHVGQISPFIPTREGGFVLYLKQPLPIDQVEMQRELPVFMDRMRDRLQIAAFNAWLNREFQTHFVAPPSDRPGAGG